MFVASTILRSQSDSGVRESLLNKHYFLKEEERTCLRVYKKDLEIETCARIKIVLSESMKSPLNTINVLLDGSKTVVKLF